MNNLVLTLLLVLSAVAVSCRQHDFRTVVIRVPQLQNHVCASIVEQAVRKQSGVDPQSVRCDSVARTVTLTYDSLLLALKNIEFAIAKAGFQANEVPASEEAAKALPAACTTPAVVPP